MIRADNLSIGEKPAYNKIMALEALEDYYDIDDILSTNEKLPCKIEMPIYRLGKELF